MSEILSRLLDDSDHENIVLFNKFKNRLFDDCARGKRIIRKKELWTPFTEITKELFGSNIDKNMFDILYSDIDPNNKGYITKNQFNSIATCLIMSLITNVEKQRNIPGREISICFDNRELPIQLEIIDTLSEDELIKFKRRRNMGLRRIRGKHNKKLYEKTKHKYIGNNGNESNNITDTEFKLIDYDSDYDI